MCVNVDELDHLRCKYKSEGIYMPNMCKKRNRFVDSGLEVRVRCSEWKRQLCAKKKLNLQLLMGIGLRTLLCQIHRRKTKGFVDDGPDVCVRCGEKDNYKYKKIKLHSLMGCGPNTRMSCGWEV